MPRRRSETWSRRRRVLSGHAATALGDLVETEGFDLLPMGACGHSRISLIIGSTATEMIRACKVPGVLVR